MLENKKNSIKLKVLEKTLPQLPLSNKKGNK